MLNSCISTSNFLVESFGFSTQSIMVSMKSKSLTSSLLNWMTFISFCCLNPEDRTSSTMLNNSGESGHPCHVPDLRGKALSFFPIENISCGSFIYDFYDVEVCSLYPYGGGFLSRKDSVFCQMLFLHLLKSSYNSYPYFY